MSCSFGGEELGFVYQASVHADAEHGQHEGDHDEQDLKPEQRTLEQESVYRFVQVRAFEPVGTPQSERQLAQGEEPDENEHGRPVAHVQGDLEVVDQSDRDHEHHSDCVQVKLKSSNLGNTILPLVSCIDHERESREQLGVEELSKVDLVETVRLLSA